MTNNLALATATKIGLTNQMSQSMSRVFFVWRFRRISLCDTLSQKPAVRAVCADWPRLVGITANACNIPYSKWRSIPGQWALLRANSKVSSTSRLTVCDSISWVQIGDGGIEHVGAKPAVDLNGSLIVRSRRRTTKQEARAVANPKRSKFPGTYAAAKLFEM